MSALRLTLYCRLDAPATPGAAVADGLTVSGGAVDAVVMGVGDWEAAADGVGDSEADGDDGLFWVEAK